MFLKTSSIIKLFSHCLQLKHEISQQKGCSDTSNLPYAILEKFHPNLVILQVWKLSFYVCLAEALYGLASRSDRLWACFRAGLRAQLSLCLLRLFPSVLGAPRDCPPCVEQRKSMDIKNTSIRSREEARPEEAGGEERQRKGRAGAQRLFAHMRWVGAKSWGKRVGDVLFT